ncbi:MAG: hypothetical protein Tsb0010_18530 [Parvularculaceae bacterium]
MTRVTRGIAAGPYLSIIETDLELEAVMLVCAAIMLAGAILLVRAISEGGLRVQRVAAPDFILAARILKTRPRATAASANDNAGPAQDMLPGAA